MAVSFNPIARLSLGEARTTDSSVTAEMLLDGNPFRVSCSLSRDPVPANNVDAVAPANNVDAVAPANNVDTVPDSFEADIAIIQRTAECSRDTALHYLRQAHWDIVEAVMLTYT